MVTVAEHSEARERAAGVTSALLGFLVPIIRAGVLGVAVLAGVILVVWSILALSFHLSH